MRKERDLKAYCKNHFVLSFTGIGIMLLQIEAGGETELIEKSSNL